jgi:hypothetical protein
MLIETRYGILTDIIRDMQECFRAHPEHYPDELDDDDEAGEYTPPPEGASTPAGTSPEDSIPTPPAATEQEEKIPVTTPVPSSPEPVPSPDSAKPEKQDPTFSAK